MSENTAAIPETTAAIPETTARAARDVRVVVSRLRRRFQETGDSRNLTPSQLSVLSRLSKDGAASTSDLAAAERIRPQSMAFTVAVLEDGGLIQRRPDPGDGRRQLISLSENGLEMIAGGRHAGEEWLGRALQDHLTDAERRTVVEAMALLERLTDL